MRNAKKHLEAKDQKLSSGSLRGSIARAASAPSGSLWDKVLCKSNMDGAAGTHNSNLIHLQVQHPELEWRYSL